MATSLKEKTNAVNYTGSQLVLLDYYSIEG